MAMSGNLSRRRFLQIAGLAVGGGHFTGFDCGNGNSLPILKPEAREIFLFSTHIAGTTYVEGIEDLEPQLPIGEKLSLFREPDNPYDERAIVIRNEDGVKLGYLPRVHNIIFSRLMDGGKMLAARISSKEFYGNWLRIEIKVYLLE